MVMAASGITWRSADRLAVGHGNRAVAGKSPAAQGTAVQGDASERQYLPHEN
jgi:hypothetical protein